MSGGIDLGASMDGLKTAFAAVTGVIRSFGFPNEDANPGDAIVGYPETITFDLTFGRGADRATFPVWVICGLPQDTTTRAFISTLLLGSSDIKDAVDGGDTIPGATVRVADAAIDRVALGPEGNRLWHLSVRFNVDVIL